MCSCYDMFKIWCKSIEHFSSYGHFGSFGPIFFNLSQTIREKKVGTLWLSPLKNSPRSPQINVDPAHAFCGRAKGANIDWWGGGRIKLTVDVLSVVSKFIDEFQPLIFETVNNIVKVLKCANSFFRGLSEWDWKI